MAKSKNLVENQINKEYGAGVLVDASFLLEEKREVVNVSPSLDLGLGGGIPEGSWCVLSGREKLGKTSLSLQIAANAQEQLNKKIYYADVEGRLKKRDLEGIHNLNTKNFHLIRSKPNKILSAEDYLSIAENIIKSEQGCVLILDSTSALCSSSEQTDELTGNKRPVGPKLLASFCRRMGNVIPIQKTILICITHLAQQQSQYASYWAEDSGQKLKFWKDVHLRAKSMKKLEDKDKQIGQVVTWDVICSSLGGPQSKVNSYLRYGYGIDDIMEYIQLAIDLGLINKAGAGWISAPDLFEEKAQGLESFRKLLMANTDKFEILKQKVQDMLK